MNQDEIKKEIKDLSYGIQFHREQGDFHHGVADKRFESVKRLEAQLTEAEKPKLRHGDYGRNRLGVSWIFLKEQIVTEITAYVPEAPQEEYIKDRFGNIFDGLKAWQEPLEKFRIDNGTSQTIRVKISGGFLRMRDDDGFMLIKECELPAFILNIQRLVYTAEKEGSGE
ncbi:hypothetical protein LCGC14_2117830 [marine sediment metagenome]|uniref:Uncharacterized protein n=1 Tax=marine sediment metagenome TaxID=412755 RepID=A0A0F9GI76_9ZZZZ